MNVGEWSAWLSRAGEAGVYFVDQGDRAPLFQAARGLGFAAVRVDLAECRSEEALFARLAAVFGFPDWFGENWDALADCLGDLSWWPAPGYVLVFDNAGPFLLSQPAAWAQLLDLLADTADAWRAAAVPFWSIAALEPARPG